MIIIHFYSKINLIASEWGWNGYAAAENLVCRINRGFCIDDRQSSMSGEGLQCRSEAATCNQERSESLQGNWRDSYQSQMGSYSPSLRHVDFRHYLSHEVTNILQHSARPPTANCRQLWCIKHLFIVSCLIVLTLNVNVNVNGLYLYCSFLVLTTSESALT